MWINDERDKYYDNTNRELQQYQEWLHHSTMEVQFSFIHFYVYFYLDFLSETKKKKKEWQIVWKKRDRRKNETFIYMFYNIYS